MYNKSLSLFFSNFIFLLPLKNPPINKVVEGFESRRSSPRFVLERALIQAVDIIHMESVDLILRISDPRDSRSAHVASRRVFISCMFSPSNFFKINFDSSIMNIFGGACFVIRDPDLRLMVIGGTHLFSPSVLEAELRVARTGIVFAILTLQADSPVIEGNPSFVME